MKKLSVICILFLSLELFSDDYLDITVHAGYTVIDLDSLVEKDENTGSFVTDWDQFNYGINIKYFFYNLDSFYIGVELIYEQLYWYQVKIPYGTQPIVRDYNISGLSLSIPFKYYVLDNVAVDLGPVFYLNAFNVGFFFSLNYYFPISEKLEIPLRFRLDFRNGTEIYFPINIGSGIVYRL